MEIKYSEKSLKQLQKIVKGNYKSGKMIIDKLEEYSSGSNKHFDIKTLKGKFGELKRLRIGDCRVIFEIIDDIIFIYEIKHRQGVYND